MSLTGIYRDISIHRKRKRITAAPSEQQHAQQYAKICRYKLSVEYRMSQTKQNEMTFMRHILNFMVETLRDI